MLEETLEKQKAKLGADHPETLKSMNNVAMAYQSVGRPDKAELLLEETLAKVKGKVGPDHPDTLVIMNNLAALYQSTERSRKAAPCSRRCWRSGRPNSEPTTRTPSMSRATWE